MSCSNAFFGSEPAPGALKACFVLAPKASGVTGIVNPPVVTGPAVGTVLAAEGGSFTVPTPTLVRFGAGTNWVEATLNGTVACRLASFGAVADPAPGVVKSCVVGGTTTTPPVTPPTTPAAGTVLAAEGGTFTLATATVVRFGADTRWVEKTITGTAICGNALFGVPDPAPGVAKSCVVGTATTTPPTTPPTTTPPAAGTVLAAEGGTFTVSAATVVRFGADTRWVEKTVTGTAACTNTFFGGTDPAPGVAKSCVVGSTTTTPPPTTTPPATGTTLAVEGATFTTTAATVVKYGAGTRWVQKTVTGTTICNNANFGGTDPAPGVVKSCVVG